MRRLLVITAVSASILGGAARCTPVSRDRIVQFFFEVPESTSQPAEAQSPSLPTAGSESPATSQAATKWDSPRRPWVPRMSFASTHPPFVKRECRACHAAEHPVMQRANAKTVCGACHETVFAKRPYLHGPFASGACAKCHQPHVSTLSKLLREPDPQQCLGCHQVVSGDNAAPRTMPQCTGQQKGIASRCLACHEPHAADERYLLKPREQWEHLLSGPASQVHADGRR